MSAGQSSPACAGHPEFCDFFCVLVSIPVSQRKECEEGKNKRQRRKGAGVGGRSYQAKQAADLEKLALPCGPRLPQLRSDQLQTVDPQYFQGSQNLHARRLSSVSSF
jgi:hypothetical protein